jgi:transcriptional regulator with XRE-family HTH domain
MKKPLVVDALVGRNIRICRRQKGLSQTELGREIGVTFQQVQKYERGVNRVGASRLALIAEALDVTVVALFRDGAAADPRAAGRSGYELIENSKALRIAKAFDRLSNGPTRLAVLHLIESVGETQSRIGRADRRKRAG